MVIVSDSAAPEGTEADATAHRASQSTRKATTGSVGADQEA
jgi:hypothetical protein